MKIKRSSRNKGSVVCGLSGLEHGTVWCHTSDCPVHQGTVAQLLVPGSTMERRPSDWPSLVKVLEVIIHPLLGVTCFV
jgi:hypothetical protein